MSLLNLPDPALGPLPPLMRPTTSLAQAVRGNTLGVGYAGGGFLVFYYIGVSKVLQQLGILRPGHYKTAGASCGVMAQAADYPGVSTPDAFVRGARDFVAACRARHNCVGTLDSAFADFVKEVMPPGSARVVNGSACSVLTWFDGGRPRAGYICNYRDDKDLVEAIRTAMYVPGWSGAGKYRIFHGRPAYDGAFAQLTPCPPNVTYCIKVACLPPYDVLASAAAALTPPLLFKTVSMGLGAVADALAPDPLESMKEALADGTLGNIDIPGWVKLLAQSQRPVADIWPGKYTTPPLTPMQMLITVFTPPGEALMEELYAWGQADGRAWAREQGWPGA